MFNVIVVILYTVPAVAADDLQSALSSFMTNCHFHSKAMKKEGPCFKSLQTPFLMPYTLIKTVAYAPYQVHYA